MKKLNKPEDFGIDVYDECIENTDNYEYFNSVRPKIFEAEGEYEEKASNSNLHLMSTDHVEVDKALMKHLYTNRFAKMGSPCRYIYDKLILSTSICPLCNQRFVKTLDHHLPKSNFPEIAILPVNLVPSCSDCNKDKLATNPASIEENTFHPYYDDFGPGVWLKADVKEVVPVVISFSVVRPHAWTQQNYERSKEHFKVYKLEALYRAQAAQELINIKFGINKLFEAGGAASVKMHLEEQLATYNHADENSWQTAMYRALCDSDWYCSGGFNR